jgi:hypothetical protein
MGVQGVTIVLAVASAFLFGALFYMEYSEVQDAKAFIEMCEIMGGEAVLGKLGTNQCFNASALLGAE